MDMKSQHYVRAIPFELQRGNRGAAGTTVYSDEQGATPRPVSSSLPSVIHIARILIFLANGHVERVLHLSPWLCS
jgi:hypothetical protein